MRNQIFTLMFVVLTATTLAGCAAKPILEEQYSHKTIMHPALQVTSIAPRGGIVYLSYDYESLVTYNLNEPLDMSFTLGRITVPPTAILLRGTLDQKDVICTAAFAYSDPLTGPIKRACFFDTGRTGKVFTVTAAPGQYWFEKDLNRSIEYSSREIFRQQNAPLKRELVYSGLSDSHLNFLYREYRDDLNVAKINQPILVAIPGFPARIDIKGVAIEVIAASEDKLTYKAISSFAQ